MESVSSKLLNLGNAKYNKYHHSLINLFAIQLKQSNILQVLIFMVFLFVNLSIYLLAEQENIHSILKVYQIKF